MYQPGFKIRVDIAPFTLRVVQIWVSTMAHGFGPLEVSNEFKPHPRHTGSTGIHRYSGSYVHIYHIYIQTDSQAGSQAGRQTERHTYMHAYIHACIQTDRQTNRQTDRHTRMHACSPFIGLFASKNVDVGAMKKLGSTGR